jgi:hypothetical protein
MTKIPERAGLERMPTPKATYLPSGDQLGLPHVSMQQAERYKSVRSVPFGRIIQTAARNLPSVPGVVRKAIHLPFGDQAGTLGPVPLGPLRSSLRPEVSRAITNRRSSKRLEASNAMRCPFGDHAGFPADPRSLLSRFRREPSVATEWMDSPYGA